MAEARVLYGGQGGSILYGGGSWRPGIPSLVHQASWLYNVGTVHKTSCTGLPFVQVQCPKTVRQTGGSVQEL